MPRRNSHLPPPFKRWTPEEKARGYIIFRNAIGMPEIESAPGRCFSLHLDAKAGQMIGVEGEPIAPRLPCFAIAATPPDRQKRRSKAAELTEWPDYGDVPDDLRISPGPRGKVIGPVSATFLAKWLGFNNGRGERFLEFCANGGLFTMLIPFRRAPGKKRVYYFDRAALEFHFLKRLCWTKGERISKVETDQAWKNRIALTGNWDKMMDEYRRSSSLAKRARRGRQYGAALRKSAR